MSASLNISGPMSVADFERQATAVYGSATVEAALKDFKKINMVTHIQYTSFKTATFGSNQANLCPTDILLRVADFIQIKFDEMNAKPKDPAPEMEVKQRKPVAPPQVERTYEPIVDRNENSDVPSRKSVIVPLVIAALSSSALAYCYFLDRCHCINKW
ncbi:MAG: hypothetical protein JSS32_07955 [Verrucomicrobia bacterium]|nr:hypothetical protein [Verrucomicrobiota bacterium]